MPDKQPPTDHAWLPSIFDVVVDQSTKKDNMIVPLETKGKKSKKIKDNIIFCVPCTQTFILRIIDKDKQICPHIIQKVN